LPWVLDGGRNTVSWGVLYGLNALASIAGAVLAGWVFLPLIGFAKTAWIAGCVVALVGLFLTPAEKRKILGLCAVAALAMAVLFQSGIGKTRVLGTWHRNHKAPVKILNAYEGPDVTTSVIEYGTGRRVLFIDGFSASETGGKTENKHYAHYMPWMGHLPMLLNPDPKRALVICFGTGQTANAVRQENPEKLDIVDINKNVFKVAGDFPRNENVLADPRVKAIVMDGRAFIRRTRHRYDVITLEPMPPTFAGVNALYSREFYMEARRKLAPHGVMAQWLPIHLVGAEYGASIVRTFQSVFPNAILWMDQSKTGILLGSTDDHQALGKNWPGFNRPGKERDLTEAQVRQAVYLDSAALKRYGSHGRMITDDNQLLSYGKATYALRGEVDQTKANDRLMEKAKASSP
jgi:spermidine synthase